VDNLLVLLITNFSCSFEDKNVEKMVH